MPGLWRLILMGSVVLAAALGSFGIAAYQADEAFACVPNSAAPDERLHFSVHDNADAKIPEPCLPAQADASARQDRTVWLYRMVVVLALGGVAALVIAGPTFGRAAEAPPGA